MTCERCEEEHDDDCDCDLCKIMKCPCPVCEECKDDCECNELYNDCDECPGYCVHVQGNYWEDRARQIRGSDSESSDSE
jgi:hypothetical protein